MQQYGSYRIELDRFNISNDNSNAATTTKGINDAIVWANSEGYQHIVLPSGTYCVRMDPSSLVAIKLVSGIHLELEQGCAIEMETNSSPSYSIIEMKAISDAKLSGGQLIGDKKTHLYEIYVNFTRGGINADGTLNDNPNWIRSDVLDRYEHPGLLTNFRLWSMTGVNASSYQFYQYKDTMSKATFVGSRTNGAFAPANPAGRGWLLNEDKDVSKNNKMVFAILLPTPLTDSQISALRGKVDNVAYTHEKGYGVSVLGSNQIEISNIEISNCTGDGIYSSWEQYYDDPSLYTQEQMGYQILIHDTNIHHCRRQGISLCGSNDVHVYRNHIHHIGFDDDGVTSNFRNGTSPMFGIDIESQVSETNIPVKSATNPSGFELNYRIYITDNYIYSNARGHFVNVDGTEINLVGNNFEGKNVGGVSSYSNYPLVAYINNSFTDCDLSVQGDNFVNGAVFVRGNLKLNDVRGAVVQNCVIKDGMVSGSSVYGYFGTPAVNVTTGTFTYSTPHGMGNGAQISFEQWVGKVPTGISIDKLYYTVNISSVAFQVSETKGGPPVVIKDAGQPGFNISRFNYGRCYLSNITIERDWRNDNALARNFNILAAGAVIRNVTVKNYDVLINVPQDYVGRPNMINGITVIEGSAKFEASHISNSEFIRAKSTVMGASDVQLGSTDAKFTRQVTLRSSLLQNSGIAVDGNSIVSGTTFLNSAIGKSDNTNKAVFSQSYLENTKVNLNWIRQNQSVTIAKSTFSGVTVTGTAPYVRLIDNTDLSSS